MTYKTLVAKSFNGQVLRVLPEDLTRLQMPYNFAQVDQETSRFVGFIDHELRRKHEGSDSGR